MDWGNTAVLILTQLFMLVGLLGLIVPVFPGIVIIWLSALGYGLVTGWGGTVGTVLFVIITILMVVGEVLDNLLMGAGARRSGASWASIGVALVAGVLGTLILPPFGGVIAAPAAVLLMEYSRVNDWDRAWKAFKGLAAGWGLSFLIRFLFGLIMVGLWWVWVWLR